MTTQTLLLARELAVAERVIREESERRRHLVVYLSGAHAYGFPSPDSDLDLKAIHFAPVRELLGLSTPNPTFDRTGTLDGVEIDYTSNEIGHALAGMLRGNGNFLERVLCPAVLASSRWLDSLRPLIQRSLSRRIHAHYSGFARNQRRELDQRPTAKCLLYVLRTALTGVHALRSGRLVVDVNELFDYYALTDARLLVEAKRAGERSVLDPRVLERWVVRADVLLEQLDAEVHDSPLPAEPANIAEIESWLVETRCSEL
jgi:uncharacterized protein